MLNCQHERCKYYKQHEFNESCATCEISPINRTFKKTVDIPCELIDRIKNTKEFLMKMEHEYMKLQLQAIRNVVEGGFDYVIENEDDGQTDFIKGRISAMNEVCELIDLIIDLED